MKRLHATAGAVVAFFLLLQNAAALPPRDEARYCMEQGDYKKAVALLKRAVKEPDIRSGDRLDLMMMLARIYRDDAGDEQKSAVLLRRIVSTPGRPDHPARKEAGKLLAVSGQFLQDHADTIRHVFEIRSRVLKPGTRIPEKEKDRLKKDRHYLAGLLKTPAWNERRYEAHYLLGLVHMKLEHFFRADRQFSKAMALKPALFLSLPVQRLRQSARHHWIRAFGYLGVRVTGGVLILVLVTGFVLSRPWTWVSVRHLIPGPVAGVGWFAAYDSLLRWTGSLGDPLETVNRDNFYPPPAYVDFMAGSPGAGVADVMFWYILAALAGVYFFSVFSTRLKKKSVAAGFNLGFAVLSAVTVLGLFYFEHCDLKSRYYGPGSNRLRGYMAFRVSEPEPYLLTNPAAYPVMALDSENDRFLVKWLERYQQ